MQLPAPLAVFSLFVFTLPVLGQQSLNGKYMATAYSDQGTTASGLYVHRHVVAADPSILPIGSRIKIRHAGRFSGEYVVADTGLKVEGRRLDIYMPNTAACKKFGIRPVRVRVLQVGDGTHAAAKEADHTVKAHVADDVAKKVVGNSATEDDWKGKGTAPAATGPKSTDTSTESTSTNPKSPSKTNTSTNPPPDADTLN